MKKFSLEFPTKSSKSVLYNCLSTPSGLSEWFCDNVDITNNGSHFVFYWDGSEQEAEILSKKDDSYIKFRWLDGEDDTYFEFRIVIDEMTNDLSLVITDFADDDEEQEEQTLLWESQVAELLRVVGG